MFLIKIFLRNANVAILNTLYKLLLLYLYMQVAKIKFNKLNKSAVKVFQSTVIKWQYFVQGVFIVFVSLEMNIDFYLEC